MLRFASLGSGSKGNATLVSSRDTLIMVDCGFSAREAERRLLRLGVDPDQLTALLVTHEHGDHCSGVAALSNKFDLPVYLTHGTWASGRCERARRPQLFDCEDVLRIGDIEVKAVAVPHDAREPCQFRFSHCGTHLGVLTDLGSITSHVIEEFQCCDALLLEFNHDLDMLMAGDYPPGLKHRVAGDWGHLNNQQAAQLLQHMGAPEYTHLVVAHVSENNNARHHVEAALLTVYDTLSKVVWAGQGEGFDWLEL